jgi:hypothetical protein
MSGYACNVCFPGVKRTSRGQVARAAFELNGHQRGLPVPLFDQYDAATKSRGSMRQRASIGIALLALSHFAFANVSSALAQAGSTGGTVGKQDKSISGGNTPEESGAATRKEPHRSIVKPLQRDQMFLESGQYEVVASGYSSTFTIKVTGSTFSGSSKWACCPGPRIDPILQGRVQNEKISFVRDCSGQGMGKCRQEYSGVINENSVSGQWTGTGAILGPGSWTMHKR